MSSIPVSHDQLFERSYNNISARMPVKFYSLKIATSLKITTGVYTPQYKQTFTLTFLKVNFHLENQNKEHCVAVELVLK